MIAIEPVEHLGGTFPFFTRYPRIVIGIHPAEQFFAASGPALTVPKRRGLRFVLSYEPVVILIEAIEGLGSSLPLVSGDLPIAVDVRPLE